MRINQILETPIEDFQLVGNFNRSSSFRHAPDRRLLTNPRYVERIKNMFANTGLDFRMWFLNSPEGGRFQEMGQVTVEWLEDNMPNTLLQIDNHETITQGRSFGPSAINIIFTGNGGAERRPMTGWIIAHRIAHVILKPNRFAWNRNDPLDQIQREVFEKLKYIFELYGVPFRGRFDDRLVNRFLMQIGTMKSAREQNIRTPYEFIYECFAQYLLKGAVTLNPAAPNLIVGYAYGRPQMSRTLRGPEASEANYAIEYIEGNMQQEFERALHGSVGKIFVM